MENRREITEIREALQPQPLCLRYLTTINNTNTRNYSFKNIINTSLTGSTKAGDYNLYKGSIDCRANLITASSLRHFQFQDPREILKTDPSAQ